MIFRSFSHNFNASFKREASEKEVKCLFFVLLSSLFLILPRFLSYYFCVFFSSQYCIVRCRRVRIENARNDKWQGIYSRNISVMTVMAQLNLSFAQCSPDLKLNSWKKFRVTTHKMLIFFFFSLYWSHSLLSSHICYFFVLSERLNEYFCCCCAISKESFFSSPRSGKWNHSKFKLYVIYVSLIVEC